MRCPHCQTSNPKRAQFCGGCGARLRQRCPQCDKRQPLGLAYCRRCGAPLAVAPPVAPQVASPPPTPRPPAARSPAARPPAARPPAARPPRAIEKFLPQELAAKLEAARSSGAMVGERRVVTMLFCDIQGSTAAAEQLDPEEWTEIINGAFELMIKPVYRYEGTVARLMGDAILAFFGAPIAHEDDPVRAVMAGLEIVQGFEPYKQQVAGKHHLQIDVRVGINTGRVVVGAVGSDMRMEYTAMGDAINVAARMEQTARPGAVQIAEDTYRRVAPLFEVETLGGIELKGKAEPVPAYRVLERKSGPARLRGIAGLDAPLIGREQEWGRLQQVLAELRQGRGQITCLIGDAGIGKSRLAQEMKHAWSGNWYECQGIAYESMRPYGQFQQLCRHFTGATPGEEAESVRQKIEKAVASLPAEQQGRARQVFRTLLAVGDASEQEEGEAFQRNLYGAMYDGLQVLAQATPTVLSFDDLQWADPPSVALLLHLLPLADEAPLLFLCQFRPERDTLAWQLKETADSSFPHRYTELRLQPLSQSDTGQLVDHLLSIAELPASLRQLILEKADGNPFFTEEIIRSLIDTGVVVRDGSGLHWRAATGPVGITIPDNIQALITSRIDRLSEAERQTLQLAAVIGRRFYFRVLDEICLVAASATAAGNRQDEAPAAVHATVREHLSALQRRQLVQEAARQPELEYMFRHMLTQETAYRSILRKRRQAYHLLVGEALERLFPERLAEHAPLLGYHFDQGGDPRAIHYHALAGDEAMRLYATQEAASHYDRALQLALKVEPEDMAALITLTGQRGRALELASRFGEALAGYEEMEKEGRRREMPALVLATLTLQGTIRANLSDQVDTAEGERLAAEGLALARQLGDKAAEARIQWNLLNTYRSQDRTDLAQEAGEKGLALARTLPERETLAFLLNDMIHIYHYNGHPDKAEETAAEAHRLWQALGNRPMLADSLTSSAMYLLLGGQFDQALARMDAALAISQETENLWGLSYSQHMAGLAHWHRGNVALALQCMRAGFTYGDQARFVVAQALCRIWYAGMLAELGAEEEADRVIQELWEKVPFFGSFNVDFAHAAAARLYMAIGRPEAAQQHIAQAEQHTMTNRMFKSLLDLNLAGYYLAAGEIEQSKAHLDSAWEWMDRMHLESYRPEILAMQAQVLLAQQKEEEARARLEEARLAAQALGSKWMLWQILAALAALNGGPQAARLRQEAGELVRQIAGTIDDESLRRSFLAQPRVRSLLPA